MRQSDRAQCRAAAPHQELLLRAALLPGQPGADAWRRWRAQGDPENLDEDSYPLLPLLYHALHRRGIATPEMGWLKGVYRRTWYENTLRFKRLAAALQALEARSIPTLALGDAAMVLGYYRDPGLRPMAEMEILVPGAHAAHAAQALSTLGWRSPAAPPRTAFEGDGGLGYRVRDVFGWELRVHVRLSYDAVLPVWDRHPLAHAAPATLSGARTAILTPADQLLHVVSRAAQPAWVQRRRGVALSWLADAWMILHDAGAPPDWQRLEEQARRFHLSGPAHDALGYVCRLLDVGMPQSALARLRAASMTPGERIAERARARPPEQWSPFVALGVRYLESTAALPQGTGTWRRITGMTRSLQRRWGSRSPCHLPWSAMVRGLRRIRTKPADEPSLRGNGPPTDF